MKLSLKWLSSLVDLSDLSTEEIISKMLKAGFEIEEVNQIGVGDKLVVGKVIECEDHPDSDHLHITKTDIGSEVLDIVCGASNCREGLKVIVALEGCQLPLGTIKKSKIRGVESNGMLCSLKELGISEDLLQEDSASHNGIEELNDEFEIGETNILEKLGYKDTVLEVSIYANRPDCLSMFGMAKEMAAILDRKCNLPDYEGSSDIGEKTELKVNSKSENCPIYMGKIINKLTLKESPLWLQERLRSNGIKVINNLVDISNYVMLETGQPLHFFDLKAIPNKEITVIDDYEKEYTALDGISYKIEKGDLIISSNNQPIAIGGVMGGDGSKILEDTTGIIIESASFNYAQIRRTANRLGLQTEAAMRFAKGLEPLAQKRAMDRAVQLLIEYADAEGIEETVSYGKCEYQEVEVKETLSHLNQLIGKEYKMDEVVSIMNRLDFKPEVDGDSFSVKVPSYRANDIKIREDLDEEIIRLSDFDDLPATLPNLQTIGELSKQQTLRRNILDYLTNQGLHEAITYTLRSKEEIDTSALSIGEAIELASPLSDARRYIRADLFSSLLEASSYNRAHSNEDCFLFEISQVYAQDNQQEHLALIASGNLNENKLRHEKVKVDFYVLKGIVYGLLERLGFNSKRLSLEVSDNENLHPYRQAKLFLDKKDLGIIGQIHPTLAKKNKINETYYCELNLDLLNESKVAEVKAKEINKYPTVNRDLAIIVDRDIEAASLIKSCLKSGGNILQSVKVFDIYQGEGIANDKKSVALSLDFESNQRTLTTQEVQEAFDKIVSNLNKEFNAEMR